ncbi:acid phosphatase [Bordetella genomosp. 12]|uniref:Acid phosphatase n=1 Tax=Bordetella genomosp. 12 TaxID=463035 RepID=A0A261VE48_9BORD|nr:acid phosphatase [Bordetella genomosp. 12]
MRPIRSKASLVLLFALLLACTLWVDRPLSMWLNAHVPNGLNIAFDTLGNLGDAGIYIVLALGLYIWSLNGLARGWQCPFKAGFDPIARASVLLLATMALGGSVTWLLKRVVARARPEELFDHGIYGVGEFFAGKPYDSFPSSHTQAAFAVAGVIAIVAPRWRWPALALAALVALSRVVNRDHYLTDVVMGAAVALSCAAFLAPRILNKNQQWPLRAPWRWWRA